MNIRTTVAKLIVNFDISLAPSEDGIMLEDNTLIRFTASPGDLSLKFVRRCT